ncbi:Retron-type reverse transcriptase [Denitratisoma oestradiolicum]|uniref:RNA-directed DNA polymerase n=1 Tax=Denitratisoma oestradiolicum TaxID=311182 RepID=A0A6S6XVT2_9PROT|nr:group II intron reverse transcriptase/maturase [Denitratisoma oestradiolicum]CAB1368167.1 Retron-type reverse transcriptase [Denitratisoma oestradiolicum]
METTEWMTAVLASDNLRSAWKRVKANKGAQGIDGVTIEDFPAHLRAHWGDIRRQLETGRYRPSAVRRVEIPKDDGGKRLLGIPTVMDRVIQQAIAQVLTPIFDPSFSASSFGFRPGRNAHQAIRQVQRHVKDGYAMAVDIDLAKFFDTVNHDVLMKILGRTIRDKALLALIGRYLRAGVQVGEHIEPNDIGTPQGGPLSPLLANILLNELDHELERRGHRFARYADDMVVLVKSRRAGERVMQSLTRYLEGRLKLKRNPAKSKVAKMSECGFLGFTIIRGKIRWLEKKLEAFKHRVRELTGRSWGVSMEYRLHKLGQYVRGWLGYFGISEYYRPIPELDEWIRRRIRMCHWKQWRWPRTKINRLLALGVSLKTAIQHGTSSKSCWHMARTPAMQQALNNDWFLAQGLPSIKTLWCQAQGYSSSPSEPTR